MKDNPVVRFAVRHERALVIAILLLGVSLRCAALGSLPMGLNQDEASAGYDAWAILNYGVDRSGASLPILLRSWGSGQNALYSYLAIPGIALLGLSELSVRLPAAVLGCLTLVLMWHFARRVRGAFEALIVLLTLAVNPWHVAISRWALESNILPFFLLLGVYFTSMTPKHPRALIGAGAAFALSLYAYGTAFFFVPLFVICAAVWLWRRGSLSFAVFAPAALVFLSMGTPIIACQLRNYLGYGELRLLGLTLPALTESRALETTILGGGSALNNYNALWSILLSQTDGLPFNSVPNAGLFYIWGLPVAGIGLGYALGSRREYPLELPMVFALAIPFAIACITAVNVNRINMIFLPIVYFCGLGVAYLVKKLGSCWSAVPLIVVLASLCVLVYSYWQEYRVGAAWYFYPGLGEAIQYVEECDPESVYITTWTEQPSIFVLFYTKPDPREYLESVRFLNPGAAFERATTYGKYTFGNMEYAYGEFLILHRYEYGSSLPIAEFGDYGVFAG